MVEKYRKFTINFGLEFDVNTRPRFGQVTDENCLLVDVSNGGQNLTPGVALGQESGEEIGVVLNVFSTGGGHDLLQVSLVSATDEGESRKIWVPFVTEIVPVVDKELRRIEIAPPQGLLELNGPAKGKDEKDSNKKVGIDPPNLLVIWVNSSLRLFTARQADYRRIFCTVGPRRQGLLVFC